MRYILVVFLLVTGAATAQNINPATQITWPRVTGSGAPTASCASANYGQPYTNTATNTQYVCSSGGWTVVGAGGGGTPGGSSGQIQYNNAGLFGGFTLNGDMTIVTSSGLATLTSVATPGTCGDATHVSQVTYDAKGRITSCTPVLITGTGGGVTAINGVAGGFTFTGSGVSCTTTTCTFSGGGSATLGGDVTGPSGSNTVVKINGGSVPVSTPVGGYDGAGKPIATPSQTADQFFAAPCGASGAPGFRGICNADLPNSSVTHIAGASMFLDMLPQHISGSTIQDQSGNGNNATFGSTPPTSTSVSITFASASSVNLPAAVNNTRTFEWAVNIQPYSIAAAFSSYFGSSLSNGAPTFLEGLYTGVPHAYVGAPGLANYIVSSAAASTSSTSYLPTGIHDIIASLGLNLGDKDRYYFDGVEVGGYLAQTFSAGLMTSGNYILGANTVLPANSFVGDMYEFITRPAELTPTQVMQEHQAIAADLALRGLGVYGIPWTTAGPTLVAQGDSLTSCQGGTGYCWVDNLSLAAGIAPFTVVNLGNPGKTALAINYSSTGVGTQYCNSNSGPNIATVNDGTNDFFSYPTSSGVNVAAAIANQVQVLSAAGCKVFVGTMIDRGNGAGSSTFTANGLSWQQNKAALNTQIRTQAKAWGAAGILDFAADTQIGCDLCSGSPLTNSSLSGNVATFTANNVWTAGELVTFSNLTNLPFLNGLTIAVSATGLSPTSFQVPFTHANVTSAAEVGYATGPDWQTDTTHLTGAGGGYAAMAAAASNTINYALGYTQSNPHSVTAATYPMTAGDGYIEAAITAPATWTLPSCIGQSAAEYTIINNTAFSITLKNALSSQPINGTDYSSVGLVIPQGFTLTDVPNLTAGAGCHWSGKASTGGITGSGTTGYLPKLTGSTAIGNSAIDDGITTASTITSTEPIAAPGFKGTGTIPTYVSLPAGTGTIPTLPANSAGFASPATGGTSYLIAPPATMTAGVAHFAAPATLNGVLQSALSSTLIGIADLSATGTPSSTTYYRGDNTWATISGGPPSGAAGGSLAGTYPNPTIAASGVTAGSYTGADITVGADGRVTAAANGTGGTGATVSSVQQQAATYAADTGAANAYVVTLAPAPTIVTGSSVVFKAANANTTTSTIAVNGGAATTINKLGGTTALAAGDISAGQVVRLVYDGTNYQMQSPVANAPAAGGSKYVVCSGRNTFTGAGLPVSTTNISSCNSVATSNETSNMITIGQAITTGCTAYFNVVATTSNTAAITGQFRKGVNSSGSITLSNVGSTFSIGASTTTQVLSFTVTGTWAIGDLLDITLTTGLSTVINNQLGNPTIICQ